MISLRLALALAALPALAAPAAAAAEPAALARLKTTHRISATAEFVNRWSYSNARECAWVGPGKLTVKTRTAVSPAVRPEINRSAGRWTILIPYFRAARDLPSVRGMGTITREDNTVQNARPAGEQPCEPEPEAGCGTQAARGVRIAILGVTRRHIDIDVSMSSRLQDRDNRCRSGFVEDWDSRVFWGTGAKQRLRLRMPSPRALRRRVVRVSDSQRKTRREEVNAGETVTDDVTRKATITFRRR